MKIYNYINPFSQDFKKSAEEFRLLPADKKCITLALSAFAGIATLFLLGIGGYATFQALVKAFTPLEAKTSNVFRKIIPQNDPLLEKVKSASDKELIALLEKPGALGKPLDEKETTPLSLLAVHGRKGVISHFLKKGTITPDTRCKYKEEECPLLLIALDHDQFDLAKMLFEKGADPTSSSSTRTPLSSLIDAYAAYKNIEGSQKEEIVDLFNTLLSRTKAEDLNKPLPKGDLLLAEACSQDLALVKALVERGADVTLQLGSILPMNAAIKGGNIEIVKYLLEKGATFEKDSSGTSFTHAISYGKVHYDLIELMIEKGANGIDEPPPFDSNLSHRGFSPLHFAIERGDKKLVELLIKGKADLDRCLPDEIPGKYEEMTSPLEMARVKGFSEIEQLLLGGGAKKRTGGVFIANKTDYTALGLKEGATWEEVKEAYKKFVRIYHPDKLQGKTEAEIAQAKVMFNKVDTAYKNLEKKLKETADLQSAQTQKSQTTPKIK